jgi:hypothetical protein
MHAAHTLSSAVLSFAQWKKVGTSVVVGAVLRPKLRAVLSYTTKKLVLKLPTTLGAKLL